MANQQKLLPIIFVLGPPGAGKSYLCNRAAKDIPEVEHIVMSDLLRAEKDKPDSPWAQEIKAKMPFGVLVSSEISTAVLQAWYNRLPQNHMNTYLLDGFPRDIEQAGDFAEKLGSAKATITLTCPPKVLLERLQKRARVDDDPKIAKERYDGHFDETVPAIDHLKETGIHVVEVSSEEEGEEGWQIFKDALLVRNVDGGNLSDLGVVEVLNALPNQQIEEIDHFDIVM
ncbi:MAG: hypothetical protein L6R38_006454 [Xanthoria sp. 2 TBL-2021]|nr:MAG: hypothetical protein L6R38_006454 [Xanthoria sp. 2 TBL-2021]